MRDSTGHYVVVTWHLWAIRRGGRYCALMPDEPTTPPQLVVLVVEDDEGLCSLIATVCERMGLTAVQTHDVAAAKAAIRARFPDLIILDLMLPEERGEALLDEMIGWPRKVPVIVISADWIALSNLRNVPTLRKPFRVAELQQLMRNALALGPHDG